MGSIFNKNWEPKLLKKEILAEGTWYYDGTIPYKIQLLRDSYDYTASDLNDIFLKANEIVKEDHIVDNINNEGQVYYWLVNMTKGASPSPYFSNLSEANTHIKKYGKVELIWFRS